MSDPIRLRDPRAGASPELRDLLVAGRSELPDAKRLSAIAGRLGIVAPLPTRIDAAARGVASKWVGTGAAKVGAAALLVGLGTAAAVAGRGHPAPNAPEAPAIELRAAPTALTAPTSNDAPEPSAEAPTLPHASAMHPAPARRVRVAPSAAPLATSSAPTASDSPVEHPPGWVPSTWGSSLAPAPPPPPQDPAVIALDRALRDERSSSGQLDEERDVVIIEALVRLGRVAEARERAARFLRVFPASAHRREIAELVGFDPGGQNR